MNERNFIIFTLLYFINILSLIFFVFNMKHYFLVGFFFLILIFLGGLIVLTSLYKNLVWSYYSGMLFFSLSTAALIYTFSLSTKSLFIFLIASAVNIIGLFISVTNLTKEEYISIKNIPVKIIKEPEEEIYYKEETKKEKPKKKEKKEEKKYLASKTGKLYHTPKCALAKKIKKQNIIWFKDEKEARKKGYKKHSCLK